MANDSIQFLTPFFKARFPKISAPDTKGQYADGKFKTDGVFLSDDDLKAVEKTLADAGKQFWPNADIVQVPVKNFYANKEDKAAKKVESRGITLKSKNKPAVFDSKKKKLPEGVKIGGGSIIRVMSTLKPWSKKEQMKVKAADGTITVEETEVFGVTMYLNDVQVRKLVEHTASGTGDGFDEDDEGFVYEGATDDAGGEQFGSATDL